MSPISPIIFVVIALMFSNVKLSAQNGFSDKKLNFTVNNASTNLKLLWATKKPDWKLAERAENTFTTTPIIVYANNPVHIKLYEKGYIDTMFIITDKSLAAIDFIPGNYDLTASAGYLFNITTLGDTKITNKIWSNVYQHNKQLPILNKMRQVYVQRSHYPFEMDEKDVHYSSFNYSFQFKVIDKEEHDEWLTLGKIYHNPKVSSSYYCLANYTRTEDAPSDFEYYWLLESTDDLQTWQRKFPLKHNVLELLNFTNSTFTFATFNKKDEIVKYNANGQVLNNIDFTGEHCNLDENKFYNCDTHIFPFSDGSKTISTPLNDADGSVHLFHTNFIWGNRNILLTDLPFKPRQLKWYDNISNELYAQMDLATNETYVYLTQRKNKLVLMSYHYTMTSNDFGKTWTFYANGIIAGTNWNVFWLDDYRLASMTNYYTDIVSIQ